MSLAATCPQCHTLFRVVPDQLKLRGGMVRCGACQHVFNANLSLSFVAEDAIALRRRAQRLDAPRPIRPAAQVDPAAQQTHPVQDAPAAQPAASPAAAGRTSSLERPSIAAFAEQGTRPAEQQRPDAPPALQPASAPAPVTPRPIEIVPASDVDASRLARREQRLARAKALREMQRAADAPALDAAASKPADRATDSASAPADPSAANPSSAEPPGASETPAPLLLSAIDTQDLAAAFLAREQAAERRAARWRHAALVGSMMGLLALGAQVAYAMRDELAQLQPALKPGLTAACEWLGCRIELPRHARALSLESIQLEALDRNGHYRVSTVLRNTGTVTTAAPHLEISFPNKSDGLLARKVLTPEQWLPPAVVNGGIAPGAEISARFGLESSLDLLGYTAAVFYP